MAARVTRRFFTTTVRRLQDQEKAELRKETKRNPELFVRHNAPGHPGPSTTSTTTHQLLT